MSQVAHIAITGLVTGCFYSLIAASLQLVYGATRILNFAQGDFVVVGMFAAWVTYGKLALPVAVSLVLDAATAAVAAAIFAVVVVLPVAKRSLLGAGLATLAGSIIVQSLLLAHYGADSDIPPPYVSDRTSERALGETISSYFSLQDAIVVGGTAIVFAFIYLVLYHTRWGLVVRASAEDRDGAVIVGVNTSVVLVGSFAFAGLVSGSAGGLMAPVLGAQFNAGSTFIIAAFLAAILGGLSNAFSSAAGGLLIGFGVAIIGYYGGASLINSWMFVAMLILLLIRPYGVFGRLVWGE